MTESERTETEPMTESERTETEPMTDPAVTYIETTLPSGPRARMWVTENCFVLEVNGRISHCSRSGSDRTDSPERIAELLPLLASASAPPT